MKFSHTLLPLEVEKLLRKAQRKTGLSDFGEWPLREPLAYLVEDYNTEANLTMMGRFFAKMDLLRLLTNRLQLVDDRRKYPQIGEEKIVKPIFITGLPRSGTTLLHNLIASDKNIRVPMYWEILYPSPPPKEETFLTDPRIKRTAGELKWLDRLQPEFKKIHMVGAEYSEECIAFTSYSFQSLVFMLTHYLPQYEQWYRQQDMLEAYKFHYYFLQQLQWGFSAKRWVLKAPIHMNYLDKIFDVYPDAQIVMMHRDPLKVVPSISSNTYHLQKTFAHDADAVRVGKTELERWSVGYHHANEVRKQFPDRFYDVNFADVTSQPLDTARKLYEHLGLDFSTQTESGMKEFLLNNPRNKHGVHSYTLEQFGFTEDQIMSSFPDYLR